jgi:hypothetical protein
MKSNVIFVKFHTRLQSTDFVVVPRPYNILIHEHEHEDEDEDEKNQIRSHAYALRLFSYRPIYRYILPCAFSPAPFLIFRIPHSNVRIPDTSHLKHTYPFAMLFMQDWGYA